MYFFDVQLQKQVKFQRWFMSFNKLKSFSKKLGLYPELRFINRHTFDREELRTDKSDLAFYSNFLNKGDLVFDVGANYGNKTRVYLKLGMRVIAFEPQNDCRQELKDRIGKNKQLVVLESALGSECGTQEFYVRDQRGTSGLVKNWENSVESSIQVPITTLDKMIEKFGKPVYIKIDVEGFEYEVFKGLSQAISTISFEYHLSNNGAEEAIKCIEYLAGIAEIKLNITPAQNLCLIYEKWHTKDEFIEIFHTHIACNKTTGYGDIIVKMETPNS
jgi:FkbM family methyltransferase